MSSEGPFACPSCARRGLLLRALAGHIDRSVGARAGERARDLLALTDLDLAAAVTSAGAGSWVHRAEAEASGPKLRGRLAETGCWTACAHRGGGGLPASLASLAASRPRALYGAGDRSLVAGLDAERSVTIVGSRRAGQYGRQVAFDLARDLAVSGLTVISGLALGIDSAAHEGALAGNGRTVAVLGPGAERAYPRSGRNLYSRIRASGAVVSELPPDSPTFRWMFPARNRLMAAMSGVTVVVEAAERSGSLITAEMAIEGGRQVGAVPGPVTSRESGGTNKLLAEGAAVIRGAQDVLDLLLGPGVASVARTGPAISPASLSLLHEVEAGASTVDAVAAGSGIGFSEALILVAGLERDGYLRCDATGRYARTVLSPPAVEVRAET